MSGTCRVDVKLSIIVPALNEEHSIAATLSNLQSLRGDGCEVLVVDGGSTDRTREIAAPLADRVITAARGRAAQMNAGAASAHGDVLVFLHADTRLPPVAAAAITHAVASGAYWGRFDVSIEARSALLPIVSALMNARSRATGIATGDQAMFATRSAFDAVGGFPSIELMEDVALCKALKRSAGQPACLRERVVTSGRRWDTHGALRTIAMMWRLRFDYWRGVSPARLAQRYRPPRHRAPLLHVFAKNPVPGAVKTRLAATLGAEGAAQLYRTLADDAVTAAVEARDAGIVAGVEIWCAPDARAAMFEQWRTRFGVTLRVQHGDDLGERMRFALASSIAERPALLIGTDAPALDARYLRQAAMALRDRDVVIGPADDGGYVLVGVARDVDIFSGICWSTADVMAATRTRLEAQRIAFVELPVLWDVDTPTDLARYRAWRAERAADAARPASELAADDAGRR